MKAQLRKMARRMAGWPLIGRFVRIGIAVIRLPEFRADYLHLNHRQHVCETEQVPMLLQTLSDLNHRQRAFEAEQLPTLLQTLSDLNHRQLVSEHDQDNLVKSVPVALRKITRDLVEHRGQLGSIAHTLEQRLSATQGQLTDVAQAFEHRLSATQTQLADTSQALAHRLSATQAQLAETSQGLEHRLSETQVQLTDVAQAFEHRLSAAQTQLTDVAQALEHRLGETRGQLDNVSNSVAYLLGRVEFVRRELLFEMRYGAASPATDGGDHLTATTAILAPDKVAAARAERVRLNLGCGHVPLEGYLNVDRRTLPGVDIVAEVDTLPFAPGEVDEIFSAHLLEHFPHEQLKRSLLQYWFGLLKPGGEFRAVVPDTDGMIHAYASGEYPFQRFREVIFGGQDYDGDFHFTMLTPTSLTELLSHAGFTDISILAENRENGGCKEFEIRARR